MKIYSVYFKFKFNVILQEFVDARGESETNEELEYIGHETETEVMGDSVGWKMQDNALNIIN